MAAERMSSGRPAQPTGDAFLDRPWEDPAARPFLVIEGLEKSFAGVPVLKGVSLSVYRGEFFSLLGSSGSGKTTLLRLLAGLERPDAGRILIDGEDITAIPPHHRPVNMMFQSYALFPHLDVFENIAFGLREERLPETEIRRRVEEMLALVEMTDFIRRRPDQLSGGQRQRVALARCLVKRPKLLLLDEPLAALDRSLRARTQLELARIQDQLGITFLMVTHDQGEAIALSSRIAVMRDGRLLQVGTPQEIYEQPVNSFVAAFVGSMNIFAGRVLPGGDAGIDIAVPDLGCRVRTRERPACPAGTELLVALHPEKIEIVSSPAGKEENPVNMTRAVVEEIAYGGAVSTFHLKLESGARLKVTRPIHSRERHADILWDQTVWVRWSESAPVVLQE